MIIYKATNKINGKVYIGQTEKDLEWRKNKHKQDSKRMDTYFYRAIKKYGWDNFEWEVIDDTAQNRKELNELEKYYIAQYQSFVDKTKGYNSTSGGEYGYKITEEQKQQRSERVRGDKNPFSNKQRVFSWKGKHFSEEHKKHLSEALTGRPAPWATGSNNWCAQPVINLMTLKQYNTIQEAANAENISVNSIDRNLRGVTEFCKGCKWAYLRDIDDVSKLTPLPRKIFGSRNKIYCPETDTIYNSLTEANSIFHFATKTIRECCLGIRDNYKGYHFRFILDDTVPSSISIEKV